MSLFRITFQGNNPAGDVFNHGLHVSGPADSAIAAVASQASTALTALLGTTGGIQAYYASSTPWVNILVEAQNVTTGVIYETYSLAVSKSGSSSSGQPLPSEVAVCVTLRSADISRSGRGRFYLPAPQSNTLTSTGRMVTAAQTSYVTSVHAFLEALNGGATGCVPVVYSRAYGATHTITSFDIGDVFDSQRRRRNKLVESRQGGTV